MERLLSRFHMAHTQPLGISVDSIYCHGGWAQSIGGVSFPLLADFHPKGAVADSYGLYLDKAGITDRATVVVDSSGVVRHASSVTPSGERNIEELVVLCEKIDMEHGSGLAAIPQPPGIGPVEALFVKSSCGHSRKAMAARENLHLQGQIPLHNVTDDVQAREELIRLAGKDQAPCMIVGGKPMHEADDIVRYLVEATTTL